MEHENERKICKEGDIQHSHSDTNTNLTALTPEGTMMQSKPLGGAKIHYSPPPHYENLMEETQQQNTQKEKWPSQNQTVDRSHKHHRQLITDRHEYSQYGWILVGCQLKSKRTDKETSFPGPHLVQAPSQDGARDRRVTNWSVVKAEVLHQESQALDSFPAVFSVSPSELSERKRRAQDEAAILKAAMRESELLRGSIARVKAMTIIEEAQNKILDIEHNHRRRVERRELESKAACLRQKRRILEMQSTCRSSCANPPGVTAQGCVTPLEFHGRLGDSINARFYTR